MISRWRGRCCASILPPPRTPALDKEAPAEPCPHCRRSRAGSFRRQRPGSRWNRQPRLCRLHSAVRLRRVYLYLPAIPPHLRRGEPRRKCSGRAGAAVPAAGAENVGQRFRRIVAAKTDSLVGTQSRLRFCPSSTAPVGTVFPGLRPRALSLRFSVVTGRAGPDPGGRLCPHTAGLCRRPGALGLPSVVPSKPVIPHALMLQTASGATLHSLRSFRALGGLETLALEPAARFSGSSTASPALPTMSRDSKPPRPSFYPRPRGGADGSGVPRSGDGI